MPLTLLSQRKLKSTERNTLYKKTPPVPYLGLELTLHVIKSQIRLVGQSLEVSCRLLSQIRLDDCRAVFVMLIVGDCTLCPDSERDSILPWIVFT
jgi:hypothetical protein